MLRGAAVTAKLTTQPLWMVANKMLDPRPGIRRLEQRLWR